MRKTFTLIELLVVVAIIAILASLLLPALAAGRDQARVMTCLTNIRQFGVASAMYAIDDGDFPTAVPACPQSAQANHYNSGSDGRQVDFLLSGGYIGDRREASCTEIRPQHYRSDGSSYYHGYRVHYGGHWEWGYRDPRKMVWFPYRYFGPRGKRGWDSVNGWYDYENDQFQYYADFAFFNGHLNSPLLKDIRNNTSQKVGTRYLHTRATHSGAALLAACADVKRIGDAYEGMFGHNGGMIYTPADVFLQEEWRNALRADGSAFSLRRRP